MLALGMTSEIYRLERMLRVGVAMVTSVLRQGGALPCKGKGLPGASGFGDWYVVRASQQEHTSRSGG